MSKVHFPRSLRAGVAHQVTTLDHPYCSFKNPFWFGWRGVPTHVCMNVRQNWSYCLYEARLHPVQGLVQSYVSLARKNRWCELFTMLWTDHKCDTVNSFSYALFGLFSPFLFFRFLYMIRMFFTTDKEKRYFFIHISWVGGKRQIIYQPLKQIIWILTVETKI